MRIGCTEQMVRKFSPIVVARWFELCGRGFDMNDTTNATTLDYLCINVIKVAFCFVV